MHMAEAAFLRKTGPGYLLDRSDWCHKNTSRKAAVQTYYKGKLYTTFEPGTSVLQANEGVFDKANSVMILKASYLVDTGSAQLLALFYADASFSE